MVVGERIKLARKGRYTQAELSEVLGVHETTIRRWEQGRDRGPDVGAITKLATLLDTSVSYLLGETDDPARSDSTSLTGQTHQSGANSSVPQTQAAQDLDALIKELASKNPDLIIHLRSTANNIKDLSEEAKQAIADGLKYVLGLAELDDLPRLKKDSGQGKI